MSAPGRPCFPHLHLKSRLPLLLHTDTVYDLALSTTNEMDMWDAIDYDALANAGGSGSGSGAAPVLQLHVLPAQRYVLSPPSSSTATTTAASSTASSSLQRPLPTAIAKLSSDCKPLLNRAGRGGVKFILTASASSSVSVAMSSNSRTAAGVHAAQASSARLQPLASPFFLHLSLAGAAGQCVLPAISGPHVLFAPLAMKGKGGGGGGGAAAAQAAMASAATTLLASYGLATTSSSSSSSSIPATCASASAASGVHGHDEQHAGCSGGNGDDDNDNDNDNDNGIQHAFFVPLELHTQQNKAHHVVVNAVRRPIINPRRDRLQPSATSTPVGSTRSNVNNTTMSAAAVSRDNSNNDNNAAIVSFSSAVDVDLAVATDHGRPQALASVYTYTPSPSPPSSSLTSPSSSSLPSSPPPFLRFRELLGVNLGGRIWDCGLLLFDYLRSSVLRNDIDYFAGKKVVEVGSGTGLVGLWLATFVMLRNRRRRDVGAGAMSSSNNSNINHIHSIRPPPSSPPPQQQQQQQLLQPPHTTFLLTDQPEAMSNLRYNVRMNLSSISGGKETCDDVTVTTSTLLWGDAAHHAQLAIQPHPQPFDAVIASDVVFNPIYFTPLLDTLDFLTLSRTGTATMTDHSADSEESRDADAHAQSMATASPLASVSSASSAPTSAPHRAEVIMAYRARAADEGQDEPFWQGAKARGWRMHIKARLNDVYMISMVRVSESQSEKRTSGMMSENESERKTDESAVTKDGISSASAAASTSSSSSTSMTAATASTTGTGAVDVVDKQLATEPQQANGAPSVHSSSLSSSLVPSTTSPTTTTDIDPLSAVATSHDDDVASGFAEGSAAGFQQVCRDGRNAGVSRGKGIAGEIAFYVGFLRMLQAMRLRQRDATTSSASASAAASASSATSTSAESDASRMPSLYSDRVADRIDKVLSKLLTSPFYTSGCDADALDDASVVLQLRSSFKVLMTQLGVWQHFKQQDDNSKQQMSF